MPKNKKRKDDLKIFIDTTEGGGMKVSTDLTPFMDKHFKKGVEYLKNYQINMAIIEFKKSLKRDEELSYFKYEQLGDCYSIKGEFFEAIKYYELSLKTNPPAVQTDNRLYNKALALKKLGRYDEAIMDLNEALRQESEFPNALILKSNCYRAKGEYKEAIKYLDKALEIDPENVLAWKNKSSLLEMIGNEF